MARHRRDRAVFKARERRAAARRRRNVLLLVLVLGALLLLALLRESDGPSARAPKGQIELVAGGEVVERFSASRAWDGLSFNEAQLNEALGRATRRTAVVRRGRVRLVREIDVEDLTRQVVDLGPDGGRVVLRRSTVAATVAAPAVRQAQKNTCESAALSILAATAGKDLDQGRIQRAFPTSGTLDPVGDGRDAVWGDPEIGYVGRPDGGGTAGGFGVYPGPVRATAGRLGLALDDLTGRPPAEVYRRLRSGRAVMAWIGLSNGPFGEWLSPEGERVRVNFGEHTVVLHGIRRDGSLVVANPLEGTREVWARSDFERRWRWLGHRALAVR